ncbi:MAG TPA: gluconolactonase [Planctomycetaceae bacterium]|nr:gluconolactonase [Planctomycetaceae bacterium]
MSTITECQVLLTPDSAELKFLPEGPYSLPDGRLSWVGIQHGGDSEVGSVNVFDQEAGNQSFELPGRPGFAFPTTQQGVFICGVERQLGLYNTTDGSWTVLADGIDSNADNTIINDGVVFGDNLVFGCKHLEFNQKIAGLYLWRGSDSQLIQLRTDQICSNGKAIQRREDGSLVLFDIDSPTKLITQATLDIAGGALSEPEVLIDLTAEDRFPDGMIATPDGQSLIVAYYDPGDPAYGIAHQYSIASGAVEAEWRCPESPRVTCPQLWQVDDRVHLVLTTAVEHMEADQLARHPEAGSLFVGETPFRTSGDQPLFPVN